MTPWVTEQQGFSILAGTLRRNDYDLLLFHLLEKREKVERVTVIVVYSASGEQWLLKSSDDSS